jgi:predicted nucleic acid-binding protein
MPIQSLEDLPRNTVVFVDANIFVYGLDGTSAQFGVTLFECVNDATHRFMLAEAWNRGFIQKPAAAALKNASHIIPQLTMYWRRTEEILGMNLLFLPVAEILIRQAQAERIASGLLTNDSLIVACMREYGIPVIASNDEDFGAISGITLFRPDDLP